MGQMKNGLLLAIDPGRVTGLALFRDGVLVAANTEHGDRIWSSKRLLCPDVDAVVIERPVSRGGRGAPGDDLIALAIRAGRAAGPWGDRVRWVRPDEWKGNLPKDLCWRRVSAALTQEEQRIADSTDDHNVRDAIGIGLYTLRRWRI